MAKSEDKNNSKLNFLFIQPIPPFVPEKMHLAGIPFSIEDVQYSFVAQKIIL